MIANAKLLTVEDDTECRAALVEGLENLGYEVRGAPDGPSGLAALEREACDLVVLDFELPGMDGIEICRREAT